MTDLDGLIEKYTFRANFHEKQKDTIAGIDREKAAEFRAIAKYLQELKEYRAEEDDLK